MIAKVVSNGSVRFARSSSAGAAATTTWRLKRTPQHKVCSRCTKGNIRYICCFTKSTAVKKIAPESAMQARIPLCCQKEPVRVNSRWTAQHDCMIAVLQQLLLLLGFLCRQHEFLHSTAATQTQALLSGRQAYLTHASITSWLALDFTLLPLTAAVRTCNECFLKNVAWDPTRTYDVFGPEEGKPVVLVHGALIGRHCMVQEAKVLAEAGYRCVCAQSCCLYGIAISYGRFSGVGSCCQASQQGISSARGP